MWLRLSGDYPDSLQILSADRSIIRESYPAPLQVWEPVFDKDHDTAKEGWSLHTASVGGDLASPRTVAKIIFAEGWGGSWSWT